MISANPFLSVVIFPTLQTLLFELLNKSLGLQLFKYISKVIFGSPFSIPVEPLANVLNNFTSASITFSYTSNSASKLSLSTVKVYLFLSSV